MPICITCLLEKDQDAFSKSKSTKSGFLNSCKDCRNAYNRQRRSGVGAKRCAVDNCSRIVKALNLCKGHWNRYKKFGDVQAHIPLPRDLSSKGFISNGYRLLYLPDHPNAGKNGTVAEHRVVMSENLGRGLFPEENVHHINGNRLDNRIENLELWSTSQPYGQRVEDKITWAISLLQQYRPEILCL